MSNAALPQPEFLRFDDEVVRIVESQEQVATTKIVGNLEEQDLLETMIESSKPGSTDPDLHYLLSTPFRYPPLRHGSRFGSRMEPSLFYASLELETCLQECAYYRFLFWYDMQVEPPRPVETQHTVFKVHLESASCVDLRAAGSDDYREQVRSPTSYEFTHRLGVYLREKDAQMILFESARGPGSNAALYTPSVFAGRPSDQELWNSQVSSQRVLFRGPNGLFQFPFGQYADDSSRLYRVS